MTDPQHEETFADTERKLREIITTLRAQLAEADELIEAQAKDHASNNIRLAETSYRAERAEAALAAQIEADAGICDALYRMALKDSDDDPSSPWKSHKASAYGTSLQAIRNQPHDRTALDRHDAKTRESALREAADELRGQGYGAAIRTILALIEKPNAR